MHPLLQTKIDLILEERDLKRRKDQFTIDFQAAVDAGEIILNDSNVTFGNLTVNRAVRTTYTYSPAVSSLQDQERFEGIASEKSTTHYRFKLTDDDTN